MLADIAEKKDDYDEVHEQFDKFLKFGIHEDTTNYNKLYVQKLYQSCSLQSRGPIWDLTGDHEDVGLIGAFGRAAAFHGACAPPSPLPA